jgi:hypothetical protein
MKPQPNHQGIDWLGGYTLYEKHHVYENIHNYSSDIGSSLPAIDRLLHASIAIGLGVS